MFNIHALNGVQYNVPLEKIQRLPKAAPPRKILGFKKDSDMMDSSPQHSYAGKAYSEALYINSAREEIFYAYEIMSSPVYTLERDIYITEAWENFVGKKVHHMPVLSESREIIGIVSDSDLLKRLIVINDSVETTTDIKVKDIMTREVISASRVTDIRRIAKAMFDNHVGTMPILDENVLLAGIITRSDILFALINSAPLKLWA